MCHNHWLFSFPVMNYGKWITDLVRQLSKLYHSGIERNFYLVVIDFNSTDIDMRRMLENSGISDRYFLIKKKGPFYKTQALNEGAALIKDPHSIVFTMDLHLKLPADIFDAIRKHTLEGLTLFVPKLVKLKCGYSPQYPQGGWDTLGYGLLGIYKTDWDRIGGMNEVEFKHKWGGEDWEIMDRAIAAGLEPQRICLPHLYHMFHSREQDWYEEARL
ncbi:predicted protein [Nematostella vectensis]|uniref:Hexosyltransferase n=1 Tax=Nematostella vectensis TaxID=45351 RepID=A7RHZ3_NEMVE|nr:predicted protein [Nematostella vectensis]|eukprot:XP_001641004.1 predicted protein [Nematostella vectensis]